MAEMRKTMRELFREQTKTALILGYTGETGKQVTQMLAKDKLFQRVTLIGRRSVQMEGLGPEFVSIQKKNV